ncbi:MAG: hypothetical protein ACI8XW_001677, partial [Gammaproteobacteria bacterium]
MAISKALRQSAALLLDVLHQNPWFDHYGPNRTILLVPV